MLRQSKKVVGEMSERQAKRILEIFENGSKNGEEWAHDVVLNRGTEKYAKNIETLNEAFRLKSIDMIVQPLEGESANIRKKRLRRALK
jgi:hypothetical protein